jgi:hypothetical protein
MATLQKYSSRCSGVNSPYSLTASPRVFSTAPLLQTNSNANGVVLINHAPFWCGIVRRRARQTKMLRTRCKKYRFRIHLRHDNSSGQDRHTDFLDQSVFDFAASGRAARATPRQSNQSARRWLVRARGHLCEETAGPRLAGDDLLHTTTNNVGET